MKHDEQKQSNRLYRYLHTVFDIAADTMTHDELHEMMQENTIIHGSNMWILIMAIFIASIGLNVNSTAVIIGAMLVSPLMSGILTMGYSLATSDLTMLKRAFTRFATQVIISLITSTLYFVISPLDVPTTEMIARTNPTLWDVMIALFGGIAGMIGNTRQKKSNVIPGVAIATALMPPLCTAGYGIATMQPRFMIGAFYLFSINTLFIMLSAALVTKLLGVPSHQAINAKKQKRIHSLITIITIITIIPSIVIGAATVYSSIMERNVNSFLDKEFVFENTQVVQSNSDHISDTVSVSLVGETISQEEISRLELKLAQYGLNGYTLHVTQNVTMSGEDADKVTIALQDNTIHELELRLAEQQALMQQQQEHVEQLEGTIAKQIDYQKLSADAATIFTRLQDCSCGAMSKGGQTYVLLTATVLGELTEDEQQVMQNWLKKETGLPVAELMITQQEPEEPEEE